MISLFLAVVGAAAVSLVLLVLLSPVLRPLFREPKPIHVQSTIGAMLCRVSAGGGADSETVLFCDPHELILQPPGWFGRREHRIPLSEVVEIAVRHLDGGRILRITWTTGTLDIDASGHTEGTVEALAERIRAQLPGGEPLEIPAELDALLDRTRSE